MDMERPEGDVPEDSRLDALMDGTPASQVEPALLPLKRLLEAAAAPGSPAEQQDGLVAALRAHGQASSPTVAARVTKQGTRKRWTIGAASAAVLLLGTATSAYAGVLPAPLQDFAHATIGAPSAAEAAADDSRDQRNPNGPAPATDSTIAPTPGGVTPPGAPDGTSWPATTPTPGANGNGNGNGNGVGVGVAKPKPTPSPKGNANGVNKPKPTPTPKGNANGVGKPKSTPTPKGNANGVGNTNGNGSRP